MIEITALYAGATALVIIGLAVNVSLMRGRTNVTLGLGGVGDDPNSPMLRAVRAHANATENAPLSLLLLALTEMIGAPGFALHALGIAILGGRLLHAHGVLTGLLATRGAGMAATYGAQSLLAIGLIAHTLA